MSVCINISSWYLEIAKQYQTDLIFLQNFVIINNETKEFNKISIVTLVTDEVNMVLNLDSSIKNEEMYKVII